ncbi:MAG: hypothetical protein ABS52_15475 [Gemmatimonadetes bacterium SCN 70-22]|nr:MAG: hypothetical protein ABS52_15475 [Gemmatimonadetes bacterium SCN 70-22]
MVDMAAALFGDFFRAEVLLGIVFVFDHDWAGREARDQIKKYGFRPDRHSLTLDPSAHPTLVGRPDVLIEDLIPLPAQEAFFALGGANCSKEYRDGQLRRIRWEHPSKAALRRYICTHSGIRDFGELVLLISRVRAALGFPAIDVRSGGTQEGGA